MKLDDLVDEIVKAAALTGETPRSGFTDSVRSLLSKNAVVLNKGEEVVVVEPGMIAWKAPGVHPGPGGRQADPEMDTLSAVLAVLLGRHRSDPEALARVADYLYDRFRLNPGEVDDGPISA